jgi:hypothetical protein
MSQAAVVYALLSAAVFGISTPAAKVLRNARLANRQRWEEFVSPCVAETFHT